MKPAKPKALKVYGYCCMFRRPGETDWHIEQDDEYPNLPAHEPLQEAAFDRVEFMKSKGLEARVVALIYQPGDTKEEFEKHRKKD